MTKDVDIGYSTSEENIRNLAEALRELKAHYNDPAGRYIEPDVSRLSSMTLHLPRTKYGPLDVLRSVGDELGYDDPSRGLMSRRLRSFKYAFSMSRRSSRPKNQPDDRKTRMACCTFASFLLRSSRRKLTAAEVMQAGGRSSSAMASRAAPADVPPQRRRFV